MNQDDWLEREFRDLENRVRRRECSHPQMIEGSVMGYDPFVFCPTCGLTKPIGIPAEVSHIPEAW